MKTETTGSAIVLALILGLVVPGTGKADPSRHEVHQYDKAFHPDTLRIEPGDVVTLHNDDGRTHNIRVYHPKLDFNSGAQEPGEDVTITFDAPGTYYVTCGIHTQMELKVTVVESDT